VITHHSPTYQDTNPMFIGDPLNMFFSSDLDYLFEDPEVAPQLWVHGHQHHARDKVYNHTRVVCNPYAYPKEKDNGFQKHRIIEL